MGELYQLQVSSPVTSRVHQTYLVVTGVLGYSPALFNNTNISSVVKIFQKEQGWLSGESSHLPPMLPGFNSQTCRRHNLWVEFVVGSRPCSEGFSLGSAVFLPPQKSTLLTSNSIWKQWMKRHFVEMPPLMIMMMMMKIIKLL